MYKNNVMLEYVVDAINSLYILGDEITACLCLLCRLELALAGISHGFCVPESILLSELSTPMLVLRDGIRSTDGMVVLGAFGAQQLDGDLGIGARAHVVARLDRDRVRHHRDAARAGAALLRHELDELPTARLRRFPPGLLNVQAGYTVCGRSLQTFPTCVIRRASALSR